MTAVDGISSIRAFHKHVDRAHVHDAKSYPDEDLNPFFAL